jgi:hypothetical protein
MRITLAALFYLYTALSPGGFLPSRAKTFLFLLYGLLSPRACRCFYLKASVALFGRGGHSLYSAPALVTVAADFL